MSSSGLSRASTLDLVSYLTNAWDEVPGHTAECSSIKIHREGRGTVVAS